MTAAFILNKELVQFRLNLKDPFLFAGHHFDAYPAGKTSYCQIWCMAFRPLSLLIARLPVCHL